MENSETLKKQQFKNIEDTVKNKKIDIFKPVKNRFTNQQIIEALKVSLEKVSPLIKNTKTLQNMVYYILKIMFIDGKNYVIASCPTGSGKTIIGFMVFFCTQYLYQKFEYKKDIDSPRINTDDIEPLAYFLTSNKALQNQIDNDIEKFSFEDYLIMLKGISNYKCLDANEKYLKIKKIPINQRDKKDIMFLDKVSEDIEKNNFVSYKFRPCATYYGKQLQTKFEKCLNECPYKLARNEASTKACTILNYAYFLNVTRKIDNEFGTYFKRRELTICDEAHLLPDIVCNMFNYEFTSFFIKKFKRFIDEIRMFGVNTNSKEYINLFEKINKLLLFFNSKINNPSAIYSYVKEVISLKDSLNFLHNSLKDGPSGGSYMMLFSETYISLLEEIYGFEIMFKEISDLLYSRPDDIYFESEKTFQTTNGFEYKHILKDLKEAELVKNNLLSKIKYGLFMSATIGDIDEYATLMGIDKSQYEGLMLPNMFDFTKSPIYLCNSGYLSYNTFERNINKVLDDVLKICKLHENEKGLIHTGTFKITNLLINKLNKYDESFKSRFLFYLNAKDKENKIELLKYSNIPYILVGPSLYEGIDLPDDMCRFQIMVKVPYAQISEYVKQKMLRYPFWYKRNCIEKIIQAIGRSNRHKNDYSKIYLLDSLFEKIIYDTTEEIQERLEYKKIF